MSETKRPQQTDYLNYAKNDSSINPAEERIRNKLINTIKFSPFWRRIYESFASIALKAIGVFIPIKENRVLFMSFGGRRYDDSPRAIFEEMISDPFFTSYDLYWAFIDPEPYKEMGIKAVRIDSIDYFTLALSSKIWVTNTSVERGMRFKKHETVCINTWHGTPIKRMGEYKDKEPVEILTSQNDIDEEFLRKKFDVDRATLFKVDLPRNDCLVGYSEQDINICKQRIGIPINKKVILYMPTYRDYLRDDNNLIYHVPQFNFEKWKNELGDDYIVLIRFHYLVNRLVTLPDDGLIINVTDYPTLTDLYLISDIFISDYSSSFVDFSILGRPMYCYAYDIDEYERERGFSINFREVMKDFICESEDELIRRIREIDWTCAEKRTAAFRKKYANHAGNATKAVVTELKKQLDAKEWLG